MKHTSHCNTDGEEVEASYIIYWKDARKKQFTFYSRIHPEYLLKIIYKIQQITNAKSKLKLS